LELDRATPPASLDEQEPHPGLPEQASEAVHPTENPVNINDWAGTGIEIARATRSWIQYGTVGFAVICIVIGAVESLFGR
jgi:hypothetical protein